MDEHPNAKLYKELDQKMSSGDVGAMADYLDDNVEWHEIGRAEPLRGKDAVVARWTSGELADYEWTGNTHDVVANDDHLIALVETTARRGDKSLTYRTAEIMHIRDGKLTARWAFSDDTEAINRFFS
jgi:ketosteroid isomerase-like protein